MNRIMVKYSSAICRHLRSSRKKDYEMMFLQSLPSSDESSVGSSGSESEYIIESRATTAPTSRSSENVGSSAGARADNQPAAEDDMSLLSVDTSGDTPDDCDMFSLPPVPDLPRHYDSLSPSSCSGSESGCSAASFDTEYMTLLLGTSPMNYFSLSDFSVGSTSSAMDCEESDAGFETGKRHYEVEDAARPSDAVPEPGMIGADATTETETLSVTLFDSSFDAIFRGHIVNSRLVADAIHEISNTSITQVTNEETKTWVLEDLYEQLDNLNVAEIRYPVERYSTQYKAIKLVKLALQGLIHEVSVFNVGSESRNNAIPDVVISNAEIEVDLAEVVLSDDDSVSLDDLF